jgi:hypothetical protein
MEWIGQEDGTLRSHRSWMEIMVGQKVVITPGKLRVKVVALNAQILHEKASIQRERPPLFFLAGVAHGIGVPYR